MGITTVGQRYDILFESLSGSIRCSDDFSLDLVLFSNIIAAIFLWVLVSVEQFTYIACFVVDENYDFFSVHFRLRKFPPKRKLLSSEEYYEQGVRETTKALEDLKKYCSSPESKPWRTMTKLKDPQRYILLASVIKWLTHIHSSLRFTSILNYCAMARNFLVSWL